jgi:hypothetical protein
VSGGPSHSRAGLRRGQRPCVFGWRGTLRGTLPLRSEGLPDLALARAAGEVGEAHEERDEVRLSDVRPYSANGRYHAGGA